MVALTQLKAQANLFSGTIQRRPQGRYAHYLVMRESESFPVFQTDGALNVIRVQAGVEDHETVSRIVMFKRKQTSPERLTGRELLRLHGLITESGERVCVYNSGEFCKKCPDCTIYGYAIGDQGAEKSKVLVDSAFSLTRYEDSHHAYHFNGLHEHGTMTDKGDTRSSFGDQDHIVPQVFFPSVVTLRDPTYESFLYVLGNLLRTSRYGAQETRTGRIENHLLGIVFTSGEIFSNLRFTQGLHDRLKQVGAYQHHPLERPTVLAMAQETIPMLLREEPVEIFAGILGNQLVDFRREVLELYQNSTQTASFLKQLDADTRVYAASVLPAPKKKRGGEADDEQE